MVFCMTRAEFNSTDCVNGTLRARFTQACLTPFVLRETCVGIAGNKNLNAVPHDQLS